MNIKLTSTVVSSALVLSLGLAACGSDATLDRTLATVERVRGGASIGDAPAARIARAAATQTITLDEHALARLALDTGPQLLLDGPLELAITDESTVALTSGRAYAEADGSEELTVVLGAATLRIRDAAVSLEGGDHPSVYVVRGEVGYTVGETRGAVSSGERLMVAGDAVEAEPVSLWHDWTGGLARPGPADAEGARGVGALEARVPDEIGAARWPLVMRRLDVAVHIEGDLAVTEVEQVFFNPASEMVEGLYRVRVPEEAVLSRFAVDRNGVLVDGYVKEKAQARAQYEAQVYAGSQLDPALLEWTAPGSYQARIYPIRPGETRRIVIRYAEWLSPIEEGGPRLYRYPMGGGRDAPLVQELSIAVDVADAEASALRAGLGAAIEGGRVRLRRSDVRPRSDFWLELDGGSTSQRAWQAPHEPPPRAPDARTIVGEADERDYWYLPLRLPPSLFEERWDDGIDLVVVADVSAGTDRAHLELGRTVTEALVGRLRPEDRVAVVASDLALRSLGEDAELAAYDPDRLESALDALARAPAGGATDLGAAISAAAGLLDGSRPSAIVYVGDGAPTVGELEADGLLDRMGRLPRPIRLYAVGVGGDANLDLLETLTRGGGLALRVEEPSGAADAALRVLAHAARPVAQRVSVEVGDTVENLYPRRPVDVVAGDVLPIAGRLRGEPPSQVVVRGTIGGADFEETIALATQPTEESTDLRLRWAGERLRQLLLDGAGREEVAELGTRYGLITPFTSYYVPSAQELQQMGGYGLRWIDRPSLLAEIDRDRASASDIVFGIALGPLGLMGCQGESSEPAAVSSADSIVGSALEMEESAPSDDPSPAEPAAVAPSMPMAEEADMGSDESARTNARYGIEGLSDREAEQGDDWRNALAGGAVTGNADDILARAEASGSSRGPTGGAAAQPMAPAAVPPPPVTTEAPPPDVQRQLRALGYSDGTGEGGGGTGEGYGSGSGSLGGRRRGGRTAGSDDLDSAAPAHAAHPRPTRVTTRRDANEQQNGLPLPDDDATAEGERRARVREGTFGWADPAQRVVVTVTDATQTRADHRRSRCSDAASASLDDREALWSERLGQQSHPSAWVDVYRTAIRDCEAPTWRDQRALLSRILARAGTIDSMTSVYRLISSGAARGYLRTAILGRVRSAEDLRSARVAFGLGTEPDWELIEQVLERARDDAARVRELRRLADEYPDSFELKLRLLELLETTGRIPEATRLADRLREDARSDPGVRTAVGEMFLRQGREDDARRAFSEIVEFAPLDELARRRLGDLYRAHGWYEDAYRQYQTLVSIRPDDPGALLLLAQAAAGAGRIDEALRLEQRLMETAQPGAERGIARIALLWSSVRLAKLRASAEDEERRTALDRRTRQSGVLRSSSDLRVTLTWSHPDAQIALYAAHPSSELARPEEIAPEFGIEAFDVPEQEEGAYAIEVRRYDPSSPTDLAAELIAVWHEGTPEERVEVIPLAFEGGRGSFRYEVTGDALRAL